MQLTQALAALAILAAVLLAGCGGSSKATGPATSSSLASTVERVRARYGLPALGLAVVDRDSIRVAVAGVRRRGSDATVQIGDRFHLGSAVKPMTATMIARRVEAGDLEWSLTLEQAFPEVAGEMDDAYRQVTLAQLLQHRGGMPPFEQLAEFAALPPFPGDAIAQRRAFARWLVTRPPAVAPGSFLYSNAGYGVAAAMAEAAAGASWDDLMIDDLFTPLDIDATFGWPTDGDPDQPWGHVEQGDTLAPFDPGAGRVPVVVAPGGDLSASLGDCAAFARLHLAALLGDAALLDDSTFALLHEPVGNYAMGWQLLTLGGRTVYAHEGSAGTFSALILLDPERSGAYVIATNAFSAQVEPAFSELLTAVVPRFTALSVGPLLRSARVPARAGR